ncbi:MAG: nicotinate-nicotinamide nucleotide adenylyltransferase [Phycisphaerales bacterium]|nr:nicotinate-nicotinamide nucleotide adenylyltransferase [Phycisphaerales bacterium]
MTERPFTHELAPVPREARLVLVFGGTFDPPTEAHRVLGSAARDAIGADVVMYIPAARSPHKAASPRASGEDRLAMLRAMTAGDLRAAVSPIELAMGEGSSGSYTVDTLRRLCVLLPGSAKMRLLIGADQAEAFHRWREPREIIDLAEPAVMLRGGADTRENLLARMAPHWPAEELARWAGRMIELPRMDASATRARELLAREGPSSPLLKGLVPGAVLGFIRERGLYR